MAKIERKYFAHFLNTAKKNEPANYERLGKDLEEYKAELNAKVERRTNIFGKQSITISGYEKSAVVDTYYAEPGTALYERLQSIIDEGLILEDLQTDMVEVKLWDMQPDGSYPAVMEECYIEVTGYGGDTSGYQIPFTLHFTGNKVQGKFSAGTKIFTIA
ncbi:MAG: hypothetical protein E7461_04355 [Ruminococcaceae bacterium]|nr:hypothetical protein [Oscillospiraceae bacterium]